MSVLSDFTMSVLLSASYLAWHALRDARKEFISQIERGRLVDVTDTEGLNRHVVTFRYRSHKYTVSVSSLILVMVIDLNPDLQASLTGPFSISLFLGEYGYGPVTVRELNGSKVSVSSNGNHSAHHTFRGYYFHSRGVPTQYMVIPEGHYEARNPFLFPGIYLIISPVSISGQTVVFTDEIDPTRIRAQMSGKLLRYVVDDGCHAEKGQVVAEMEVMKM
jgi:hypothetical protein